MSSPSEPSAGTARPDAATAAQIINATLVGLSDAQVADYWYQRAIEVESEMLDVRSQLAEREADTARLDWLEARLLTDADFEIMGQPDTRWPRFVLTNHPEASGIQRDTLREAIDAAKLLWADAPSAAVAPAARPTEDANDD